MQAWRHDIHRYPELAFEETRTADKVIELLTSFGIEVHTGIGNTGVVGVLKKGSSDKMIGLRADMDALLIHEQNTFDHRSQHDGKNARLRTRRSHRYVTGRSKSAGRKRQL